MRYEECERFGNGFLLRAPPLNLDSLWPIVPTTTTSELMLNHTKGVYGYSSFCQISLLALEDGQEMALLLDAVVCMYTVCA